MRREKTLLRYINAICYSVNYELLGLFAFQLTSKYKNKMHI